MLTRKNAIVEYLDYQKPVSLKMGIHKTIQLKSLKLGRTLFRVPRLSDTRYSPKGNQREMEICKQQSEMKCATQMRQLPAISIFGYVGGIQT